MDTRVLSISSGTISDLTANLRDKPARSVGTVVTVGGGNDCDQGKNVEDILADFDELIEVSKRCAEKVKISSIPPRRPSDLDLVEKIKAVNLISKPARRFAD